MPALFKIRKCGVGQMKPFVRWLLLPQEFSVPEPPATGGGHEGPGFPAYLLPELLPSGLI